MNHALRSILSASLLTGLFLASSASEAADTVTTVTGKNTVTTCKRAPAGLSSFMMEHPVDVTTIKSTLDAGGIPGEVAGQIFDPVNPKEIRSRISYDKTTGILDNQLFLVNPGDPLPSSSDKDFDADQFAFIKVKVDKVYISCKPRAAVMLTGKTLDGFPIYIPPAGAPYAFSFSYTVGAEDQGFSDIVSLSSGLALLYHDKAPGTISWTSPKK